MGQQQSGPATQAVKRPAPVVKRNPTTCPVGSSKIGDGSACMNHATGKQCALWGNASMDRCFACPGGMTAYGDGSACTGGGRPNCALWGNATLPRCQLQFNTPIGTPSKDSIMVTNMYQDPPAKTPAQISHETARGDLAAIGNAPNFIPQTPTGTAPSTQPSAGTPSAPTPLAPSNVTVVTEPVVGSAMMVTPSPYQSGLYRHMIWKLLQQDDPNLLVQMHERISPEELDDGVFYLQNEERDALSAPQTAAFFDNQKRMDQILDDLAAWMKELSRRQRARGPVGAVVGAFVRKMDRNQSLILAILLLLAAGAGFMYVRSQKK